MQTPSALTLALGIFLCLSLAARAQDKDAAPKLDGKYTLTAGKVKGKEIDDAAKKGRYTFTSDKITIEGNEIKFVISYKLNAKAKPTAIDMEILDGPVGTKGAKAQGIVELKGDVLKLAYSLAKEKAEKDNRPKDFDGKDANVNVFELKKAR